MNKAAYGLFISLFLVALFSLVGCNKETTDSPTQPGDPDSPSYELFADEFDGMNSLVTGMFGNSFLLMDSIMSGTEATSRLRLPAMRATSISTVWNDAIQSWICTVEEINDETTVLIVDTIKFWHATTAVQWPLFDSLTQISNHYWMTVEAADGGGGTAHYITNMAREGTLHQTLVIDGNGAISAALNSTEVDSSGTTTCAGTMEFTFTAVDLTLDLNNMWNEGDLNCPVSGALNYTGEVDLECTGATTASASGQWTVGMTFDDGTVSLVYTNGTNNWSATDDCGGGSEPGDDSIFVATYFDSPDQFMTGFQTLDLSVALLDSIQAPTVSRPLPVRSALLGDDEIMVITAIISYDYSSNWHIFNFEAMVIDTISHDTVTIAGIDSVQCYLGDELVPYPSGIESIDQLRNRLHCSWEKITGADWGRIHHRGIVTVSEIEATQVLILNGTVHDTVYVESEDEISGYCDVTVALDLTASNLTMETEGSNGCPIDGEVLAEAEFDAHCDGIGDGSGTFDYNGSWTVNATANTDQTITLTFTGGDFHWSSTQECLDGLSAPPWGGR